MRVQVRFFAIFREMVGIKSEWADVADGTTVGQLWARYASQHPRIANIRAAFAVNQHLSKGDQVLQNGDEIGFLPPVSGGVEKHARRPKEKSEGPRRPASRVPQDVAITRRRLDLGALVERVEFPGAGAILTFSGVVRDNSKGKAVGYLDYEAYPEMAEAAMRDIISEIHARWREVRVAMAHRVGKLKIGDASLIIAVSAAHRPEAYAASRYAIERVKAILPVWKKEFATDGEYWVEGPVAGELPPEKADAIVRDTEHTWNRKQPPPVDSRK